MFADRFGSRTVERSSVVTSEISYHSVIRRQSCIRATRHPSVLILHRQPPQPPSKRAWRRAMASPHPRPTAHLPTIGRRPGLTPLTRRRSIRSPPGPTALGRQQVLQRRCRAAQWTAAAAAVDRPERALTLTNRTRWRGSIKTKLPGDVEKLWLAGSTYVRILAFLETSAVFADTSNKSM